jgi:transcriptional regulator NrdR family protein
MTSEDLRRVARDIEATLVDSGRKSVLWSDIVMLAMQRLRNVDAIAAHRLEANYTDESGAVRFEQTAANRSSQLGLPLTDDD